MMKRMALSLGLLVATLLAVAPGCDIRTCEGDHCGGKDDDDGDCDDGDKGADDGEAGAVCGAFCGRLVGCGSIAAAGEQACVSACVASFKDDADRTRSGCQCVSRDACRPVGEYSCDGAPLPGGNGSAGASGSGGSSSSAGGASAGGSSSGGSGGSGGTASTGGPLCETNHDCALGEDCVSSRCLPRCHASCECRKGESCVEGYCEMDAPPPEVCLSDCECPSGQTCTAGACH
jgi:Cys-rich repeat protein